MAKDGHNGHNDIDDDYDDSDDDDDDDNNNNNNRLTAIRANNTSCSEQSDLRNENSRSFGTCGTHCSVTLRRVQE
jgi:hypothetical protein